LAAPLRSIISLAVVLTLACERRPTPAPAATSTPAPFEIQLLAFNDFHGALEPPAGRYGAIDTDDGPVPAGGAAFLKTWVDKLAIDPARTLVVAAGDNIGATPLISAAFHDEPTIEALSLVGLALSSVGNHEFDEGIDELRRMQDGGCHPVDGCFGGDGFDGAAFGFLAANVRKDDGETLFPPYAVRTFADPAQPDAKVDVAFIGMTLEGTPEVVTAAGVRGVSFADEVDTVAALIPELHQKGIHAIVVCSWFSPKGIERSPRSHALISSLALMSPSLRTASTMARSRYKTSSARSGSAAISGLRRINASRTNCSTKTSCVCRGMFSLAR
jgi:5'-nucleotidase